jgi:hypothetical protein
MATPRRTTGDTRAARTQLKTADQTARIGKDQRAIEGPGGALTAPLGDKEFRLAENVGIMPLMEWAAASDVDVASADGLRAVYYVLQDAVHEEDWAEFRRYSREHKVKAEELLDFANAALEVLAGRPTEAASGSSDGS